MSFRDFIFLGTGTSGCVPSVRCITAKPEISCPTCARACLLKQTADSSTQQYLLNDRFSPSLGIPSCTLRNDCALKINGSYHLINHSGFNENSNPNHRMNTAGLVRVVHYAASAKDASEKRPYSFYNVLIDCGKTFYESTLRWFSSYEVRSVDAVLITHDHADAMYGLPLLHSVLVAGGLRGGGSTRKKKVPVYLSDISLELVNDRFVELFDCEKNGGECLFEFNLIKGFERFDLGVYGEENKLINLFSVLPFPVLHGVDYYSMGFRFGQTAYISDAVKLCDRTRHAIKDCNTIILDCLKNEPMKSHFSYSESIEEVKRILKLRTGTTTEGESDLDKRPCVFLTGMCHLLEHGECDFRCQREDMVVEGSDGEGDKECRVNLNIRMAYDGLCVKIE